MERRRPGGPATRSGPRRSAAPGRRSSRLYLLSRRSLPADTATVTDLVTLVPLLSRCITNTRHGSGGQGGRGGGRPAHTMVGGLRAIRNQELPLLQEELGAALVRG